MNFSFHRILSLLGLLGVSPLLLWGTYGTKVVDRDEFFRRMEARAMSLSQKMAGISGTEPIKLITPKKKSSIPMLPERQAPQQYYNALPGLPEPKPASSFVPDSNRTFPPSVVYKEPEESYFEIKPTTEELKGAFQLRPFVAFMAPGKTKYMYNKEQASFTENAGFSLGVIGSRRIGNWKADLRFGYLRNEYSGTLISPNDAVGEMELFSLSAQIGYAFPVTDTLSLSSSFGLGYGSRSNDFTFTPIKSVFKRYADSSMTFDLGLGLDYKFSDVMSAYLGYRLMGVSDNGPFDRMTLHLFELGLGANF